MMYYYYNHTNKKRQFVNMELDGDEVVRLHINDEEKTVEFVKELSRQLEQLEKLDKFNQDNAR